MTKYVLQCRRSPQYDPLTGQCGLHPLRDRYIEVNGRYEAVPGDGLLEMLRLY